MVQKKHSAPQKEHPALQNIKFSDFDLFLLVSLPSWIRILTNNDLSVSGSTTLVKITVLRIRDVYPGSRILIFTRPGSKNSNKREG
jgi:hypothetical protein